MANQIVRQLLASGYKPAKRQIALEPPSFQNVLKDWDDLFHKDNILYLKHSLSGNDIKQLLLPEVYRDIALVGRFDEAGNQARDHNMPLVKYIFPVWMVTLSNILEIVQGASPERLNERQQPS